jgi:hypothetical protein
MAHPYVKHEGTALWATVESAISDLVQNDDLVETTARPYIVGYLCQRILDEREALQTSLGT